MDSPLIRRQCSCRPDWLHQIKYDGYGLRLERDGDRVRLITRDAYNWTNRYPWMLRPRAKSGTSG